MIELFDKSPKVQMKTCGLATPAVRDIIAIAKYTFSPSKEYRLRRVAEGPLSPIQAGVCDSYTFSDGRMVHDITIRHSATELCATMTLVHELAHAWGPVPFAQKSHSADWRDAYIQLLYAVKPYYPKCMGPCDMHASHAFDPRYLLREAS